MWFKKRTLIDSIFETRKVKVDGVVFKIRKINPIDYLTGAKSLQVFFETYESKKLLEAPEEDVKKIKEHYRDVIMSSVQEPKLTRKQEEEGFFIDNLFNNWGLVNKLYEEIMMFSHGKKKV